MHLLLWLVAFLSPHMSGSLPKRGPFLKYSESSPCTVAALLSLPFPFPKTRTLIPLQKCALLISPLAALVERNHCNSSTELLVHTLLTNIEVKFGEAWARGLVVECTNP